MILVPRYLSPMRVVKSKSSSSLSGGSPHKMSGSASPEKTPTKKSQSLAIFLNKGNDVWSCISLTFLKPIFSWPEPKAQVSFSDHNLWSPSFWRIWNFSLFICKYFNYCTDYQLKYIISYPCHLEEKIRITKNNNFLCMYEEFEKFKYCVMYVKTNMVIKKLPILLVYKSLLSFNVFSSWLIEQLKQ